MSSFRKSKDCPSSDELLGTLSGCIPGDSGLRIAHHLAGCDFCAGELEFYRHFPPEEENTTSEDMPGPLRELAEALLSRGTIHVSRLEGMLNNIAEKRSGRDRRRAMSGSGRS
jgi:hypothetical protein